MWLAMEFPAVLSCMTGLQGCTHCQNSMSIEEQDRPNCPSHGVPSMNVAHCQDRCGMPLHKHVRKCKTLNVFRDVEVDQGNRLP